jgi:D-alanyl-D-alanine carboxypeptidase
MVTVKPRISWRVVVVSVLIAALMPAAAEPVGAAPMLDSDKVRRLDATIEQTLRTAAIPGAIIGIWTPGESYVRAFGTADQATGRAMQPDFYSRIGSVTKTFTATGVLQLVDEGRVGLDDPVGRYVDGVPRGDEITLRQLAGMTSGLFDYTATQQFDQALEADPYRSYTPRELLGWAFAEPEMFAPGEGFGYSNTNTILLGLVVEAVSGQSLANYIHDAILTPLGLVHTSLPATNTLPDPHPQGYTDQTGPVVAATNWDPSWEWAAGGMISTLDDLRIWARAVATGRLLSPATQAQRLVMTAVPGAAPPSGYGLGIMNNNGWIGHSGALPGFEAFSAFLADGQMTLVILTNTDVPYREPARGHVAAVANAITKIVSPDYVTLVAG